LNIFELDFGDISEISLGCYNHLIVYDILRLVSFIEDETFWVNISNLFALLRDEGVKVLKLCRSRLYFA